MIPWWLRALAVGLVLSAIVYAGWLVHDGIWQDGYKTATAELTAKYDAERRKAEQAAREQERRHAEALNAAAEKYEQDKRHAQEQADRVVADMRAGTLRLRREWAGCETARVSAATAAAAEPDATAADRSESAGRIVRAAAECDAQVTGLQEVIRAWTSTSKP